ncbi:hypothetical protein XELAEV_18001403mg [Xenopus laevis]|nr:hypothetical protein XELAEV_18001403mg [Xenopus laevis]
MASCQPDSQSDNDSEAWQRLTKKEWTERLIEMMRTAQLRDNVDDPCFPNDPSRRQMSHSENPAEEVHHRQQNLDWCQCKNCVLMPTVKECICCKEIPNVVTLMGPAITCIVENPTFIERCLKEDYVYFMLRMVKNLKKHPSDDEYHRYLRMTAYRSFTIWVHYFLGKKKRRPIPSCVVKAIRTAFPDSYGLYRGFVPLEDYPAVDMAEDLDFVVL